jgi:DNA-binding MarR family transcriptional regulator
MAQSNKSMMNQAMSKQGQVGLLLAAVRRRQRQAVETRVGPLGISSQQFWVLESVFQRGECGLGEILATLPMDQPTTSRVLAALQERRLVAIQSDVADRRRRRVRLTSQGKRLAAHCAVFAEEIRNALLVGLHAAELATLRQCLTRMVRNLDRLDGVETARSCGQLSAKGRLTGSNGSHRVRS